MIKDSTINGMTVEEMRASLTEDWGWDRAPTDVVLSLLDALESAQREADEAKKEAAANKGNADSNYAKWCAERERAEKAEAQAAEIKERCAKVPEQMASAMEARSRGDLGSMFADQSATDLRRAAGRIRALADFEGGGNG